MNRFLLDALVDAALAGAEGDTAHDLYAGSGLFSLALARRFREVIAVESAPRGQRPPRQRRTRRPAKRPRGEAIRREIPGRARSRARFHAARLAPRRLGQNDCGGISPLAPTRHHDRCVDPVTLARDLAGLSAAGCQLDRLTLIDLFPQTYHLETVAQVSWPAQ